MKFVALLLAFLLPTQAMALHLRSHSAGINLNTDKVSHVKGEITDQSAAMFLLEEVTTAKIPGDRIILIDSFGGSVLAGQRMVDEIEKERAVGVRQVCVVTGEADSMAFNLLTHCDVRLASSDAHLLFHKVALSEMPDARRLTAQFFRKLAKEMDQIDEQFCVDNAKAMHLTRLLYDKLADGEADWSAQELLDRGYLHGIVRVAP